MSALDWASSAENECEQDGFDATARHGPEQLIETPMQYLSIIIYPKRG